MRVLITGNLGYIGPVLDKHLNRSQVGMEIVGFDSGFFAHCLTNAGRLPECRIKTQHFGDMRHFSSELLEGVDAVVHLAAVSNDPMGAEFETVTGQINQQASIELARMARDAGVGHFVFASSCSMYGFAEGGARKEEDPINPLTAYARSKAGTEAALREMDPGNMIITNLRFGTACGMSERLRLDLVLNDFVACAVASHQITVLSDGSPWRPLIDVEDMSRAIEWGMVRRAEAGGQVLSVNVGVDEWNYQVRDLAQAVATEVPGTQISINKDAPPDKRSYRVNFDRFRSLAPDHQPRISLEESIKRLHDGLVDMNFSDADFRNSPYIRLQMLRNHMAEGRLTSDLVWQ